MKYTFKPSHIVPATLFVVAVLYGGSKPPMPTNPPPDDVSSPTNAPMMCAGSLRGRGLSQTSQVDQPSIASGGLGQTAAPVMFEVISNWTARGAYCDWQRIDFSDGFQFPVGTNFIDGVTLFAWGEIKSNFHCSRRPSAISLRSIATSDFDFSLPSRVSLEPGVSSVTHGLTPSNSYLFAWHNCCVERCATNRVDASIELFRSGEVAIRTTSTVQPSTFDLQPPIVPEGYYGHGQDEDWIRATFPGEADNILMSDYAAWLAQWVGDNEQNGRYLARVTISQPPATNDQSPIYLTCGPYRVNVAAPGTYSFPLEVFETYEVRTYPAAVPFTVDFDDGYTGGGSSYEIVEVPDRPRLLMMGPASQTLTFYRFYMKPHLLISPSVISRAEADGARISFWCNLANVTRRFVRTAAREFYLNFCWPSDAEIEAAEDDLENEIAAEDDSMEVVYHCPKGECSGWIYIEGYDDDEDDDDDDDEREDASIYSGPAWQTSYSNDCLVCQLTVTTTDGSTATHEESGAAILAEGQSAEVSVYFETTEYGGDIYDDEVEWQVLVNGAAAMSGSASVSSATSGEALETQRVNPPPDGVLRIRLVGRARNVADGLRQSCVRIVVTAIDEGDAHGQP